METEIIDALEKTVEKLIKDYVVVKEEVRGLREENNRLVEERQALKARIGAIVEKLEGI
jgi:cell division protein ZapB